MSCLSPRQAPDFWPFMPNFGALCLLSTNSPNLRRAILQGLFPAPPPFGFNAEQIDDFLPEGIAPSVVLMNPPFSVTPNVDGPSLLAGLRHLSSALARLSPKGRLVALLSDRFDPCSPRFAEGFARLCETGRLVFHATVDGALYQRHGTTTATRMLVFDKEPAGASVLPPHPAMPPSLRPCSGLSMRACRRALPHRRP